MSLKTSVDCPWEPVFLGDRSVVLLFEQKICPEVHARIETEERRIRDCLDAILGHEPGAGTSPPFRCELVRAYASITLVFESPPPRRELQRLLRRLQKLNRKNDFGSEAAPRDSAALLEIPVRYGGEEGPDLAETAQILGLSEDELIRLHTEREYLVHFLGFSPGFPYLGGLAPELHIPRLESPRAMVSPGSVGLAGGQTGVYTVRGPGGWRLIGRAETKLFDPRRTPSTLLKPGMRVRFVKVG